MSDAISIDLGSALPYLTDRALALFGRDADSARWRSQIESLIRLSITEASHVQCVGMPQPIPIQDIYQPLTLLSVGTPAQTEHFPELLEKRANCVIFAGPGRGKTTLLHWAYTQLLKSKSNLPLLFTLRWPGAVDMFTDFVDGVSRGRSLHQRKREVTLLVDGYDEVSEEDRKTVSRSLNLFAGLDIGHFCLTCRSFYDVFDLKIPQYNLAPFTGDEATRFTAAFSKASGFYLDPMALLTELYEHGFQDFASHPLMLALVCILRTGPEKEIPRRAIGLVERAIQTLTLRWDQSKGIRRQTDVPLDGYERVRCLTRAAFEMPYLRASWDIIDRSIRKHLKLIQVKGVDPRQLMREIAQWYGVVVPVGPDEWEFVHRTIHDYLAARFWVDTGGFGAATPKEWNSQAAYATCLTPDATRNMVLMLDSASGFPAFSECLYNRAAFDPEAVGQAFISRVERRGKVLDTKETRISANIEEDAFGNFTDEALRMLLLLAGKRPGDASKAVALYAIGELANRKEPVMSHNLVGHIADFYRVARNVEIELFRAGASRQVYRLRDAVG